MNREGLFQELEDALCSFIDCVREARGSWNTDLFEVIGSCEISNVFWLGAIKNLGTRTSGRSSQ